MADAGERNENEQDQNEGNRKRQKLSKVWDHFTLKYKENAVVCKHCKVELAYHNSTSSMLQHLSRTHPTEGMSGRAETSKTSQTVMDRFLLKAPACTSSCTDRQHSKYAGYRHAPPLSMVEDVGFKAMIAAFQPNYALPCRTFFTKRLEEKYEHIKNKMKKALQETDTIAFTTDIWKSVATEAYMGERHTAANIADWIEEVIVKFNIPPEKIKAVVHDNGANVVAATKILHAKHGYEPVTCAGHTLNLVVQNSLKSQQAISRCVGAARTLVEHFKKSELASTKLKVKQRNMGTKENMLLQDVCTRWNSTYAMLTRLQEQRWPVTATLSDPEVTQRGKHYLDLKPDQWGLIEELNQVLEPFHSATVLMSGEQYVTLSSLPHVVDKIKKLLQNLESPPVVSFQTHAKEQVTTRWKNLGEFKPESPNITLLAASLDPRFRKLKFLPADQVFGVKNTLQTMALAVKQQVRPTGSRNETSSTAEGTPSAA
uniref:BED-type domain-containing protein n=1 Tax=Iconisemion striatum TaxID=60296 RepID=A0A1A7WKA9_9TELE